MTNKQGKAQATDSSQPNQSKVREPRHHAYDSPTLGPRTFLLAVMRDPTARLADRIRAAVRLMELWPDIYANDSAPAFAYHIEGIPIQ